MACNKLIPEKSGHIFIYLLTLALLLASCNFMANGRKFTEFSQSTLRRSVIGSMPPRCDEKCKSCGHCEAIQVPIVPSKAKAKAKRKSIYFYYAYSRGDDISNYKPMCWKCKCGDFIFNP